MNQKTKKSRSSHHDALVKRILAKEDPTFRIELFKLLLSPKQFDLFRWDTLEASIESFVDSSLTEKRTDILFTVQLKSNQEVKMLFIFEHKSKEDAPGWENSTTKQILEYMLLMYSKDNIPIIPIIFYHGKNEKWRGPLSFQDSLKGMTSEIKESFGGNIIDFIHLFINVHQLKNAKDIKKLAIWPFLFLLANIWNLSEELIDELFILVNKIDEKHYKELIEAMAVYINKINPKFTLDVFTKIETKNVKKEKRIMQKFKTIREEFLEEGREEGLEEGLEKGREEGREEGIKKVAMMMIKNNIDDSDILLFTKLSKKELQALKKELELV